MWLHMKWNQVGGALPNWDHGRCQSHERNTVTSLQSVHFVRVGRLSAGNSGVFESCFWSASWIIRPTSFVGAPQGVPSSGPTLDKRLPFQCSVFCPNWKGCSLSLQVMDTHIFSTATHSKWLCLLLHLWESLSSHSRMFWQVFFLCVWLGHE